MRRLAVTSTVFVLLLMFGPAPAAHAGGGGCHTGRTEVSATAVDIENFCFTQTVVHVAPGSTVTWTNHDQTQHFVTGVAGEWGDYESLDPNASVTHHFDAVGVYPYFCALHPGMVGAVVVDHAPENAAAPVAAPSRRGSATIGWIAGGALASVAAVALVSFYVARRQTAPRPAAAG